jgi:hypothetical protein
MKTCYRFRLAPETEVQNSNGIKIIDLQNWVTGTYIVSLKSNGKIIQSEKFTKY